VIPHCCAHSDGRQLLDAGLRATQISRCGSPIGFPLLRRTTPSIYSLLLLCGHTERVSGNAIVPSVAVALLCPLLCFDGGGVCFVSCARASASIARGSGCSASATAKLDPQQRLHSTKSLYRTVLCCNLDQLSRGFMQLTYSRIMLIIPQHVRKAYEASADIICV
jgi:hypothetical protein